MDRSYIAFISYRHRPLDMAVARKLHGMIERYRVPRALRRCGARLGLVFRDQEELPVSSDLAANIRDALASARYLIVVCTPDTPQSPWVEREIEYFLETHSRENVFAVLAAGAPEESFPWRLTHATGPGGEVLRVEPLAANVAGRSRREVLRKLRAEKLRLIAGMLGCPYDELRQRERRRARRRTAAVAAVAACVALAFIGVLWSGNVRMRAKNQELRRSQAEALAQLASVRLGQGDLRGAIESGADSLDLGGAPSDVLAEQVLCDALNPYSLGEARVEAILRQPTEIEDMLVSGERVCTIDAAGTVRAFDASGDAALWESPRLGEACSPFNHAPRLYELDGGAVLAKYGDELRALSADGAALWSFRLNFSGMCDFAALSEDRSALAVADWDSQTGEWVLRFLSAGDGRERCAVRWDREQLRFESNGYRDRTTLGAFSADGDRFVGWGYAPDGDGRTALRFFEVDLADGSVRDFYEEDALYRDDPGVDSARTHVLGMALDEAGKVLTVAACNDAGGVVLLERVRLADGEVLSREGADWVEQPRELYDLSFDLEARAGFLHTPMRSVVQLGSHLYVFDVEGGYLGDCDTWGECALRIDAYAWDNAFAILTDGGSCAACVALENGAQLWSRALQLGAAKLAAPGEGGCLVAPEAVAGGSELVLGRDEFVEPTDAGFVAVVPEARPDEVRILRPRLDPADSGGEAVPGWSGHLDGASLTGGRIALAGQGKLKLLDAASRTVALEVEANAAASPERTCRVTSDGRYLIYPDADGEMVRCALETGDVEKLADAEGEAVRALAQSDPAGGPVVSAAAVYYVFPERPLRVDWWLDGEPQEPSVCPFSPEDFCEVGTWLAGGGYVVAEYADGAAGGLCFAAFSTEDGSWRRIENPHSAALKHVCCAGTEHPLLASLGDDGRIRIWNLETGEVEREFDADVSGRDAVQLRFLNADAQLLLLSADGGIRVYDVEREACACALETGAAASEYTDVCVGVDAARNRLYLAVGGHGFCLDMGSWTRLAAIPNLRAYLPEMDEVLIEAPDEGLCVLPALDAGDLSKLGRALIGE